MKCFVSHVRIFSPGRLVAGVFALLVSVASVSAQSRYVRVAANDCGAEGRQPFLVKGDNYVMTGLSGSEAALTCNFGATVVYAFDRMNIRADYRLEVVYLSDGDRRQRIVADGNELQSPFDLVPGEEHRFTIDLPRKAYAYGQLVLVFEALRGSNAIVSELNLYSTDSVPPVPFEGEQKTALARTPAYKVDTTVCPEPLLPRYAPFPRQVAGVREPVVSLNGTWRFCERPEPGFQFRDTLSGAWEPITVPGQWSSQGFRVDSAAFAGYRTRFVLPDDWAGRRVRIRFDGVFSQCEVFLNGAFAGSHLGGMTPFELEITPWIRPGENRLDLRVCSESQADLLGSLTQYAAHPLGGITRKVTLYAVPEVYLSDLRVVTDLDDRYEDADLRLFVAVTNASADERRGISLRAALEGLPVVCRDTLPVLAPGATWSGWLSGRVVRPEKWTNESPRLYGLQIDLSQDGRLLERTGRKIGFREVEVHGNRLLVNGVPVKLRGVCRHEAHPLSGRVLTPELQRRDVELYRAANCNFIRTSHYPPSEEFLDLCDELGMFVEAEAPVCWVGHHANTRWQRLNYRDSGYYDYILQANLENIHFNRNHPSVLFWSMANESYWNEGFAQVQEYVRKADPSRPFTFHDQAYGGFNNQGSTAPIANIHYPGPNGYKVAARSDRPMIYGEYCHLNVYNRSELVTDPGVRSDWALALAPAWENMYRTDGVLGGSLWSGIDDVFQMPDGSAVGYGPWGPVDGWRRPKPEYWDMKKVYSPVRVLAGRVEPADTLRIAVENRYGYLNLNALRIDWRCGSRSGTAVADVAPGETGVLSLPAHAEEGDLLRLVFTDPRGFTADEYGIPVGGPEKETSALLPSRSTRLKTADDRYRITGRRFLCEISRSTGQILTLVRDGREVLTGGPWMMVLPLTGGGCYPDHNARTPVFNDLCSGWETGEVAAVRDGDDVRITVSGRYRECEGSYTLRINAGGTLALEYDFRMSAAVNPRQWGMVFEAPASFDRLFWRREGMWSVYPDDHIGRPEGEARLFYPEAEDDDPRKEPGHAWSMDANELGSNDFRATRRNIFQAGLYDPAGGRLTVRSDGRQHWRSWKAEQGVRFLVADFVTAGNEMFLESYYAPYRKPLKEGDRLQGRIVLLAE